MVRENKWSEGPRIVHITIPADITERFCMGFGGSLTLLQILTPAPIFFVNIWFACLFNEGLEC